MYRSAIARPSSAASNRALAAAAIEIRAPDIGRGRREPAAEEPDERVIGEQAIESSEAFAPAAQSLSEIVEGRAVDRKTRIPCLIDHGVEVRPQTTGLIVPRKVAGDREDAEDRDDGGERQAAGQQRRAPPGMGRPRPATGPRVSGDWHSAAGVARPR